ncbi:Aste57867_13038 [Aphanomyces stellatus]|uniref:Aste57867_13038 protein n=1 Tax=Aphanomyces stellatus TaxID=120398 RepID=A0A485KZ73_9STRA|nr:hypothetical protein As57867_012990 [Aphanomyces stellatus]VFT89883.1 Aste57867_13038 [Aphanomyces stellatus]
MEPYDYYAALDILKQRIVDNNLVETHMMEYMATLLVLEDIDTLVKGRDQEYLCRFFEWAHDSTSSVILVTTANTVDLVSKYLPMLRRRECSPIHLTFSPYGYDAIVDILKQRIVNDNLIDKHVLDYMAVAVLNRNVASTSGGIGTALRIS